MRPGKFRKLLLLQVMGFLAIGLASCLGAAGSDRPKVRKVVLVSIDTLRADRLGCYGYDQPTSPNLDAWAEKAMVFERATVQAPWTGPSMASMLTGRYPVETGVYTNHSALRSEIPSIAESFSEAGFKTAWFNTNPVLMLNQGGFREGFQIVAPQGRLTAKLPYSKIEPEVSSWLEANAAEDFFLWIHNMDPHSPPTEGNPYHKTKELAEYDGEIRLVDDAMGRLFAKLEQLGIADETMVVFTADHGEAFSEHLLPGHQNVIYDEVLHVPLIVRLPGVGEGARTSEPVEIVDLFRTIADAAGLAVPDSVRGESLIPILSGKAKLRQREFSFHARYYNNIVSQHQLAVRDRDYKLVAKLPIIGDMRKPGRAARNEPRWTLDRPGTTLELYRYTDDKREQLNLIFSGADPSITEKLKKALVDWRDDVYSAGKAKAPERKLDDKTIETLRKLGYAK